MAIKSCQKCGLQFTCEGDNDCWCEKVHLHRKAMVEIMERYNDCLCPECLAEFEEE